MSCRLLFVLSWTLVSGCATFSDDEVQESKPFTSLTVYYGTDRARAELSDPQRFYGGERGKVEFGETRLAVPASEDPAELNMVIPLSREDYLSRLRQAVQSSESRTVFIFIHGYNRSFSQGAGLSTDFSRDIKFSGVPIFWSWPSTNNPAGYVEDRNNIRWGRPHLSAFLRDVIESSGAVTVHLLGHSMGGFALVDSFLYDLLPNNLDTRRIGEFVLLAPDIDAEVFRRDIGPKLVDAGMNITLYTSSNDRAMASSHAINGYPRAGDSFDGPTLVPGIETIDATAANNSILGHSYFEESQTVGYDLAELLNNRTRAADRKLLTPYKLPAGIYWRLDIE
jgi:esterase/lipase superfamily enzyme